MKFPLLLIVLLFAGLAISCDHTKQTKSAQPTSEYKHTFPSVDPLGLSDKSRFWSIDEGGAIREWSFALDSTITGGKVTGTVKSKESGCSGLAWCSVLSGAGDDKKSTLHVFMSDNSLDEGYLSVVPLTKSSAVGIADAKNMMNMGGWQNYLYIEYCSYRDEGTPNGLMRWKNKSFEKILTLEKTEEFGSADIAVDTLGRAWVLIGHWDYESTKSLDLRCYGPDGKQIVSIPVRGVSQMNAYGFMLLRGKFYVAFGSLNKQFPDRLVELVYVEGKMKPGKSYPFKTEGHDVASEDPGCPTFPGMSQPK